MGRRVVRILRDTFVRCSGPAVLPLQLRAYPQRVYHPETKGHTPKKAGGHSIRFHTVPYKAMESDGKQGLMTLVYLQEKASPEVPQRMLLFSTVAEAMNIFERFALRV